MLAPGGPCGFRLRSLLECGGLDAALFCDRTISSARKVHGIRRQSNVEPLHSTMGIFIPLGHDRVTRTRRYPGKVIFPAARLDFLLLNLPRSALVLRGRLWKQLTCPCIPARCSLTLEATNVTPKKLLNRFSFGLSFSVFSWGLSARVQKNLLA